MLLTILFAALQTPVAAPKAAKPTPRQPTTIAKACPELSRLARSRDGGLLWRNEPVQVDLHAAMVRKVDGCIVPAILRRNPRR